jgi:hypothetical protein
VLAGMLKLCKIEPDFVNWVITGNENWVFKYYSETKRESEEWHMPKLKSGIRSCHFQTLYSIQTSSAA